MIKSYQIAFIFKPVFTKNGFHGMNIVCITFDIL